MGNLNIQIQPGRAPELDMRALRKLCEKLVRGKVSFSVGSEGADYVNLMFEADDLRELWELLERRLYLDKTFGASLGKASIVVCEGTRGWDDYMLLHHFDWSQRLDGFSDD